MKEMSLMQWLAIGAGVLLLLQQLKIVDLSKIPILSGILSALKLTPSATTSTGTAVLPPSGGTGEVDRFIRIQASMLEVRHFLSEQTGDARKLLDSCDQFDRVINEAKKNAATNAAKQQ